VFRILLKMSIGISRILVPRTGIETNSSAPSSFGEGRVIEKNKFEL
jgi:hypothetical protein